jgi:hypothetical protein
MMRRKQQPTNKVNEGRNRQQNLDRGVEREVQQPTKDKEVHECDQKSTIPANVNVLASCTPFSILATVANRAADAAPKNSGSTSQELC